MHNFSFETFKPSFEIFVFDLRQGNKGIYAQEIFHMTQKFAASCLTHRIKIIITCFLADEAKLCSNYLQF